MPEIQVVRFHGQSYTGDVWPEKEESKPIVSGIVTEVDKKFARCHAVNYKSGSTTVVQQGQV